MPLWRSHVQDPAGSVPPRLRRTILWGGAGLLVAAVMWNSWQRQEHLEPPPPPNPAEAQAPPAAAVVGQADRRVEDNAREMAEADRQRALMLAQRRIEEQKARRRLQVAVGEHLHDPEGTLPPHLVLPEGAQAELDVVAEEIRQTEQRRRYESLRAPQIVATAAAAPRPARPDEHPPPPAPIAPEPSPAQVQDSGPGADPLQSALVDAIRHPGRFPHLYEPGSAPDSSAPPPTPAGTASGGMQTAAMLTAPDDPPGWERIHEGEFLEGVLTTQLRGDFPGPANAMVAIDLWSRDRQRVLVPRGTRVLGTAAAVAATSQARLAVAFHRLIYPTGAWVDLDSFTGLNQLGETGLKDRVNNHYLSMFGTAAAVGLLSGLSQAGATTNFYGIGVTATDRARLGLGAGTAQAGMTILNRLTNRLPTITIRAGHRLRIYFTSDVLVPREIASTRRK